jgi:glycosyltransferase involved in cell wall biosynthesis
MDIQGQAFHQILDQCAAVVYPSCAEGQATSVLNCMRAGLIPIVTPESGISVADFGLTLPDPSVETIRHAIRSLATLPADEVRHRADRTWQYTVEHHSPEAYLREYRTVIGTIVSEVGKRH